MASTVVGLFEARADAEASRDELVGSGFGQADIELKAPGEMDDDGLITLLEGEGVPTDDARLYAEGARAGDTLQILRADDDDRAPQARDIMNRHGALDIHAPVPPAQDAVLMPAPAAFPAPTALPGLPAPPELLALPAPSAATPPTEGQRVEGETVIPVVEEALAVGKRQVRRGGVRVFRRTEARPVEAQVTLREEHVTVQRQAVDRPVTDADAAFQDSVIEVNEVDEEAVVAKSARVVGEVVIGKTATERTETVRDTVRRTEVEVEKIPAASEAGETVEADPA